MRLTSLCLLPSSWHSSAGFPYPFAAIARGPLAFATRWIWAADIAESIETAAVRAPLCLRFPLLLSSVQAGVGLLSPPPTPARRVHPPVLPSVAEAAAAIRLASASDAQRSAARPGVSPAAAAAGDAALTWFTSPSHSVLDPVLRGGGRRSPVSRDAPSEAIGFQWPTSTFPAAPPRPAARSPAAGPDDPPAVVNWVIQPDRADPRIRASVVSILGAVSSRRWIFVFVWHWLALWLCPCRSFPPMKGSTVAVCGLLPPAPLFCLSFWH